MNDGEASIGDVEATTLFEIDRCTRITKVIDELGVVNECHGNIISF